MAIATGTALAASAALGAGASVYSANKQKKAARDGTRAQTQAAEDANRLQWEMYQQGRTDNEPFRNNALTAQSEFMQLLGLSPYGASGGAQPQTQPTAGASPMGGLSGSGVPGSWRDTPVGMRMEPGQVGGGGRLAALLQGGGGGSPGGLTANTGGPGQVSGGAPQVATGGQVPPSADPNAGQMAAYDRFRNTPGYMFGLNEGRGQVESSAAARGGLNSGATLKALQRYGNDYADQQGFTPYMNRLASLAGMGQTANAQNAQLGMNYANQAGANFNNAANARASGLAAGANATSNMWGNVAGIGGWLAGQYSNRPPATGGGYTPFNNSPGGGGFGWLGGGG